MTTREFIDSVEAAFRSKPAPRVHPTPPPKPEEPPITLGALLKWLERVEGVKMRRAYIQDILRQSPPPVPVSSHTQIGLVPGQVLTASALNSALFAQQQIRGGLS